MTVDSVDREEVARFAEMAGEWWDAEGPMAPLHAMNPPRIRYIRDAAAEHFDLDVTSRYPFKSLKVIDVGCGAGILSEALARLGADVTAIDAAEESIAVAKEHAGDAGLQIDYRCDLAENLAAAGESFDLVVSMEVLEHVNSPREFLHSCAALTRKGGLMAFSTINRTAKSFAFAIVAAERILRLVPHGTHSHEKFIKPAELRRYLREADAEVFDITGMGFTPASVLDPKHMDWRLTRDPSVNYLACAVKG